MNCKFVAQLSRLRKLSAESVENTSMFDSFKEYLHVERQVEMELRELLRNINANQKKCLVLLCGSAGDGKSHLIPVKYEPNEKMNREYCGKNPDTKARYHQLQRNMVEFLRDNN